MDRPRRTSTSSTKSTHSVGLEPPRKESKPDCTLPPIGALFNAADQGEQKAPSNGKEPRDLRPTGIDFWRKEINDDTAIFLEDRPLKTYYPEYKHEDDKGFPYTMIQPTNETTEVYTRQTKDGKTLTYTLHVVQQPARARACGSGPRSSADRRPVDPPPVIELHVYLGDEKTGQDITIGYDATFILYASLEVARPIANGRMFTGPITPVLTGVPVAGIAYLDKPNKAGYFIFSDLSVRHEGWFNLKFDLFEAVKNPGDAAPGLHAESMPVEREGKHIGSNERLVNLTFVRSEKFQVFSAKKFPGLDQSTDISRVIADQGCRVRIRREVRQRKRVAAKPDQNDDDDMRTSRAPSESIHLATPSEHTRSLSRNSNDASQFANDNYRRMSSDVTFPSHSLPPINMMPSSRGPSPHPTVTPPPFHAQSQFPSPTQPIPRSASSSFSLPPRRPALENQSYSNHQSYDPIRRPSEPKIILPSLVMGPPQLPTVSYNAPSSPLITLAPMMDNRTLPPPTPSTGSNSSLWHTESILQKRTHSSSTYPEGTPLKDRARPDEQRPAQSEHLAGAHLAGAWTRGVAGSSNTWSAAIIQPDDDTSSMEEGHESDESLGNTAYSYKRADGTAGNKVVIHAGWGARRLPIPR